MSLIVTTVSSNGIVTATDSFTTYSSSTGLDSGPNSDKLFKSPHLDLILSVCGDLLIEGEDVEQWIPRFLGASTASNVQGVSESLLTELRKQEPLPEQIIHIAGYEEMNGESSPIVGHISSVDLVGTGYQPKEGGYALEWNYRAPKYNSSFYDEKGIAIFNGFGDGRDAFSELHRKMNAYRREVWSGSRWKFTPPDLIAEAASLKLELEQIAILFRHSDYPVPFIGGRIQIATLPWPGNAQL